MPDLYWSRAVVTSVSTMAELAAMPGQLGGQSVTVRGFYIDGDGGGGEFYWDDGSGEPEVSGMVVNATGGQWRRLYSGIVNVHSFGAIGDGIADDTAALQACFDFAVPKSGIVLMNGHFRITAPVFIRGFEQGGTVILRGFNSPGGTFTYSTVVWDGESYDGTDLTKLPALWIEGADICVENIAVSSSGGKILYSAIECGSVDSTPKPLFRNQFRGITILGTGTDLIENGISFGTINPQPDFFEDMIIENCTFDNCDVGVLFGSGQPHNTVIQRCIFENNLGGVPQGTGIRTDVAEVGLHLENCDFRAHEIGAHIVNGMTNVTFRGGEALDCKKLLYAPGTGAPRPGVLSISNMRLSPAQIGASTALFLSSDHDFIYNYSGSNIRVEGNYAIDSLAASVDWNIAFHSMCRVTSSSNDYPNDSPFKPGGPAGPFTGGIWSAADRYVNGVSPDLVPLPTRMGGINTVGSVTLSGNSQTNVSIPLLLSEFNTDYHVRFDLETAINPTAGATSAWVSNKTISSFWINIGSAPGSGDSVSFTYIIWR